MPIRLLLVDDHAVFRQMAARVLAEEQDIVVAGQAESVESAVQMLPEVKPDLVLLDYEFQGMNGMHFLGRAQAAGFTGRVLLLSAAVPDFELRRAVAMGALGFVSKEEPLERVLAAIRAASEGRAWLDQRSVQVLADSRRPEERMTERELSVLSALVQGFSNKELADRFQVPETTIKSWLQTLFKKTGVRTRAALVRVALEKYRPSLH